MPAPRLGKTSDGRRLPPGDASAVANRVWKAARRKVRVCRSRWWIAAHEICSVAGVKASLLETYLDQTLGPRLVDAEPAIVPRIEEALNVIVRERARNTLARLDPQFAAWDAVRREQDRERERIARLEAVREAQKIVGDDVDLVLGC